MWAQKSAFFIKAIEILDRSGHDEHGHLDKDTSAKRADREDF